MPTPDPDREIYPNAPLKLVTFELRFNAIDLHPAATERFVEALRASYPITAPRPFSSCCLGPPARPRARQAPACSIPRGAKR
jgi:hypothetical protein